MMRDVRAALARFIADAEARGRALPALAEHGPDAGGRESQRWCHAPLAMPLMTRTTSENNSTRQSNGTLWSLGSSDDPAAARPERCPQRPFVRLREAAGEQQVGGVDARAHEEHCPSLLLWECHRSIPHIHAVCPLEVCGQHCQEGDRAPCKVSRSSALFHMSCQRRRITAH
jgi:hypothetical protein